MIVTKYFNSELMPKYQDGAFKFGTLSEYRASEGQPVARMSDVGEGIVENLYGEGGSASIKHWNIGNVELKDVEINGCKGAAVATVHTVNDWVFCATDGAYSEGHHLTMLNGEKSGDNPYIGNSDLNAYVEIDLNIFLKYLFFWLKKEKIVKTEAAFRKDVIIKRIDYGDRVGKYSAPSYLNETPVSEEAYIRTVFTKPKFFQPENEIRIVYRGSRLNEIPAFKKPLFPKSMGLQKSIISSGTLNK